MSYMDLLRCRAEMLKHWREWAERVAKAAVGVLPGSEVYVLGSVVRGDWTGGSDIDILIVSDLVPDGLHRRAEVKGKIEEESGLSSLSPIEIHLTSRKEAVCYIRRAGRHIIKLN